MADSADSANFRCPVLPAPTARVSQCKAAFAAASGAFVPSRPLIFVSGAMTAVEIYVGTWGNVAEQAAVCCPRLVLEGDDNVDSRGRGCLFVEDVSRCVAVEFGPGRKWDGVRSAAARARWPGCVDSLRRTVILLLLGELGGQGGQSTLRWDNVRRVLVEFRPGRRRFGAWGATAMQQAQ